MIIHGELERVVFPAEDVVAVLAESGAYHALGMVMKSSGKEG